MKKPWLGLVVMSLLLTSAAAHANDKVYRWTDQDGVVHFSSSPPPSEQQAEEINLPRDQPALQFEVESDDPEEADTAPPSQAQVRARNCEISRSNLAKLESAESALRTDPETGEQVEIRGDDLRAAIRTTLEQIREFCI